MIYRLVLEMGNTLVTQLFPELLLAQFSSAKKNG